MTTPVPAAFHIRPSRGWLNDPKRYDSVPRRSAQAAPRARLSDEWVAALEKHGICTRIPRAEVRGHVRMFAVPEPAKKRFRPIKHTADANECLGKDTLLPLHFPSKADIVGGSAEPCSSKRVRASATAIGDTSPVEIAPTTLSARAATAAASPPASDHGSTSTVRACASAGEEDAPSDSTTNAAVDARKRALGEPPPEHVEALSPPNRRCAMRAC